MKESNLFCLPVKPLYHRPNIALIQLLQKLHLLSEKTINGFLLFMNVHNRKEEYFNNEFCKNIDPKWDTVQWATHS